MKRNIVKALLIGMVGAWMGSQANAQAPEVDLLALRIASEACIREFERAALNPQRESKPVSNWQAQDLKRELVALSQAIESRSKSDPNYSPAVELATMMTLKVATASYHLASNDLVEAKKVIDEATKLYDERYKPLTATQKQQLKNLGYAGDRIRLVDTLNMMLTTDRIEKLKIAETIRDPGRKKLTLWKAESLLPKVQAQLACVLFDLDRYLAVHNTVTTKATPDGKDEEVEKESDTEERKGCELSMRDWSVQTFQTVANVHSQFLDAKKLLEDIGGTVSVAEAPTNKPLKFLGAVRLDANGDGNITQLEVERLHASFSKDYPVEFLTSVLGTLQSIKSELESSESVSQSRLMQIAADHGFEGGRKFKVKSNPNRVLLFDFLNYARTKSVETANGQVRSSSLCIAKQDFFQDLGDGKSESQYEIMLADAKFLAQ